MENTNETYNIPFLRVLITGVIVSLPVLSAETLAAISILSIRVGSSLFINCTVTSSVIVSYSISNACVFSRSHSCFSVLTIPVER